MYIYKKLKKILKFIIFKQYYMSIHKIYNRKLSDLTNGVDDVIIYTEVVDILDTSISIELIRKHLDLIDESYEKEELFGNMFGNVKRYRARVGLVIFDIIMTSKNMLDTRNGSRIINTVIRKIDKFVEYDKIWFDEIKVRTSSGSHINGTDALLRIRDGIVRYMAATDILEYMDKIMSMAETKPKIRERTYGHMTLRTLKY